MSGPTCRVEIASTGRFLPDRILTNHDLEAIVDTSDEWIRTRTGIRERRIADDDTLASDMGAAAARCAIKKVGGNPEDIDLLVLSTATPDRWLPATACDVQAKLGASRAMAFDLMGACTGFLYGLSMAEGYIAAGRGSNVLVIATEKMSSIVDWTDRSTCVLFGDGAAAALVRRSENGGGILSSHLRSDGALGELLYRPAGGTAQALDEGVLQRGDHLVRMAGREVFKNAVRRMADAATHALQDAGLGTDDIALMVPHQANIRIVEATARYAGIPEDKVFINVDRYGNMSSATVPVALDEAIETGRLSRGDHVLLVAFGAGLTWGAMVLRL